SGFGLGGLRQLDRELSRLPRSARLLVQYVPHAFGWKAMNLPLCLWLGGLRRPVWVMFHEVAFPCEPGQPWKHRLLGAVTRQMAGMVCRAADRIFVSTPVWEAVLREVGAPVSSVTWLPIPSPLPLAVPAEEVAALRSRVAPTGTSVVGHFGT